MDDTWQQQVKEGGREKGGDIHLRNRCGNKTSQSTNKAGTKQIKQVQKHFKAQIKRKCSRNQRGKNRLREEKMYAKS